MKLIATDEAGYGPKIGPLVIAATQWQIADANAEPDDPFAPLRERCMVGDVSVAVDDSKVVYQPSSDNPLAGLHAAVSVCNGWWMRSDLSFAGFLKAVADQDIRSLQTTPWLRSTDGDAFVGEPEISAALAYWNSGGAACENLRARVITAKQFNQACDHGMNKADLLSESTLTLVRGLLRDCVGQPEPISVYCDRHGGRRYYAGVIQHVFCDSNVHIVSETKQQSVYRIVADDYEAVIHFTVKGDRFTPVAMTSMYAKYIRERMMRSLNQYFADRHDPGKRLKPTAGYPVDADRFLNDVQSTIQRERIAIDDFVRKR